MLYKSEGRCLDPRWCHGIFHWHKSFWPHYGPGVDSASNRNEYQVYFLGVNAAGAYSWQPYPHPVPLSRNLGTLTSWNPLGHLRPVTGLLYLFLEHLYPAFSLSAETVEPWLKNINIIGNTDILSSPVKYHLNTISGESFHNIYKECTD
jgi:hypothetical protein